MHRPTTDINDRDFFSDANMAALSEPASYADWAPGENEVGVSVRPRPVGDSSSLPYGDGVETVNIGGNK